MDVFFPQVAFSLTVYHSSRKHISSNALWSLPLSAPVRCEGREVEEKSPTSCRTEGKANGSDWHFLSQGKSMQSQLV